MTHLLKLDTFHIRSVRWRRSRGDGPWSRWLWIWWSENGIEWTALSEECEDEWKGFGPTQKMRGGDAFVQEIHLKSFCPRRWGTPPDKMALTMGWIFALLSNVDPARPHPHCSPSHIKTPIHTPSSRISMARIANPVLWWWLCDLMTWRCRCWLTMSHCPSHWSPLWPSVPQVCPTQPHHWCPGIILSIPYHTYPIHTNGMPSLAYPGPIPAAI